MKERLKQIRKQNPHGKSQQEFSEFLGISLSNLASYESGRRVPSNAAIKLICDKCGVNETWLLDGSGEMKAPPSREAEIARMVADIVHCDDNLKMELIREITAMTPEQISAMKGIILRLADVIRGE